MSELTPPDGADEEAREPDIVLVILRRVVAANPGIDPQTIVAIEAEIRAQYGGRRYFLPKRKKHPTPAQRRAIVRDGLSSLATSEIEQRHGVDRSTIYRALKGWAKRGED